MNNLEQFSIVSEMNEDKEYIENLVLETDQGTKRMKEKFYEAAATERNNYVNEKLSSYRQIEEGLLHEMEERIPRLIPEDHSEVYNQESLELDRLLDVVQLNSNSSNSFKLKLDYILAGINDLTSLEDMNIKIREFIRCFGEYGISLTITDFQYTMFTEMYMNKFFENSDYDSVKDTFEEIYFKCPDIKLQLKMNLRSLIKKYDKELGNYVATLKTKMFGEFSIPVGGDVVGKYVNARFTLGDRIATDEFYNTNVFLEGTKKIDDYLIDSPTRNKIYNSFTLSGDFNSFSDDEKKLFNDAMMGFYLTLNELKKFYHFEFILKDLIEYYKDKTSAKGQYLAKKKEVEKEEKTRLSLMSQYRKACGIGFLARKSETKQKYVMLQMNNHIRKLKELYDQLDELEIRYQVSSCEDSSSIYDLFLVSLQSFPFLEKCFSTEEFQEHSLEENVVEFLRFVYNPNNGFLRKINGLNDYNITDIVAEKYRLLNLNVTSEAVQPEVVDSMLQDAQFINLIQNIERSKITLEYISNLCKMNDIIKSAQK